MSEYLDELTFFVPGVPVPQGSMKAFVVKGRAHIVHSNPRLDAWRAAVTKAAALAADGRVFPPGAIRQRLTFYMPRGVTVKRDLPTVPPDLDKLVRGIGDAITKSGVWEDDARVTDSSEKKRYHPDQPGVLIELTVT